MEVTSWIGFFCCLLALVIVPYRFAMTISPRFAPLSWSFSSSILSLLIFQESPTFRYWCLFHGRELSLVSAGLIVAIIVDSFRRPQRMPVAKARDIKVA